MSQSLSERRITKLISLQEKANKSLCCITEALSVLTAPPIPEYEYELWCNPDDGTTVLGFVDTATKALTFQNTDNTPYTGNPPVVCSNSLESDALDYCLGGTPYTKWVLKDNGLPTGDVYWTDESNTLVAVPVGATRGKCEECTCTGEDFFTTITTSGTITIPFEADKINIIPNSNCCTAVVTLKGTNYTGTPITIRSGRAYSFSKSCPLIDEILVSDLTCKKGLDVYAETDTKTCN